jgi:hypothetical protein
MSLVEVESQNCRVSIHKVSVPDMKQGSADHAAAVQKRVMRSDAQSSAWQAGSVTNVPPGQPRSGIK